MNTLSMGRIGGFTFLALFALIALPAWGEDARWQADTAAGQKAFRAGRYDEAAKSFSSALTTAQASGIEDARLATSLNNLAEVYRVQDKDDAATPLSKQVIAIREKVLGPDHPDVAAALINLAKCYRGQRKAAAYEAAEPLYKRAIAIMEKAYGPDDLAVVKSLNELAEMSRDQGARKDKLAEVVPLYERVLAIQEKALGAENPAVAESLSRLGSFYLRVQRKYDEAEPLLRRSLAIRQKVLGPDDPKVADSFSALAAWYKLQGNYAAALPLLKRAMEIKDKAMGPEPQDKARSLDAAAKATGVGEAYQALGR